MDNAAASARVWWSTAGTTPLLTIDYTGLDGASMLDVLAEARDEALAAPEPFAVLIEVTGAAPNSDWLVTLKKQSRTVWEPRVTRCAVAGIHGLKAALLRGFNAVGGVRALPVASKDQALRWLAGGPL